MKEKGDIQDRDEARPRAIEDDAAVKFSIIREAFEKGGVIHVYLRGQSEGEDIHLTKFKSHLYEDVGDHGVIFTMIGDEEKWIFPEEVTHIERHYDE